MQNNERKEDLNKELVEVVNAFRPPTFLGFYDFHIIDEAIKQLLEQQQNECCNKIEALIKAGAHPNISFPDRCNGGTLLMHVVDTIKDVRIAKTLIDNCARVNETDGNRRSALNFATEYNNNVQMVKLLVDSGANTKNRDRLGRTPLHGTVLNRLKPASNNLEIANILIKADANINEQDGERDTPLHWAASEGKLEMVELLISSEAKLNIKGDFSETHIFNPT